MKKKMKRLLSSVFAVSLAMTSAMPVFAAETETVNVTVNDVAGGSIVAYYYGENGHTVYLPVGETTDVPCGAKMTIETNGISYTTDAGTKITSYVDQLWLNEEPVYPGETQKVYVYEDMTIDALFSGEEKTPTNGSKGTDIAFRLEDGTFSTSYGVMNADEFVSQPLCCYDFETEEEIELANLKFGIYEVEYENEQGEVDWIDNPFSITENGLLELGTHAELEPGIYSMDGWYTYTDIDDEDYEYTTNEKGFVLEVYVGACVEIELPYAVYAKDHSSNSWGVEDGKSYHVYLDSVEDVTYGDVFDMYLEQYENELENDEVEGDYCKIAGVDVVALGSFNNEDGSITDCMEELVSNDVSVNNLHVRKYLISEDYELPELDVLGNENTIIQLEELESGWNEINGDWYYKDDGRLSRDRTEKCNRIHEPIEDAETSTSRDKCKEKVYFDYNGVFVKDTVMEINGKWYVFDEYGHRETYSGSQAKNGIVWEIADGELTGNIEAVDIPTTAIEAAMLAHTVKDNRGDMSAESFVMAADALTTGLAENVEPSEIKRQMVTNGFEYVYKYAYPDLEVEKVEGMSIRRGGLAGAGILSDDVTDGNATIKYEAEWLGTSSNAQENLSLGLYVNGEERTELNSKIQVRVALPETYLASNSNATMDDDAVEAVEVDMEEGLLTFWTSRLGTFEIFGDVDSDDEEETPGADDEEEIPGTDDEEETPGTDDEEEIPGTDDEEETPGAGDEEETPGADDEEEIPGADDEEEIPGTDDEEETPGTDNNDNETENGSNDSDDDDKGTSSSKGSSTAAKNSSGTAVEGESGAWTQSENGWKFKLEDGTSPVNRWARLTWGNRSSWYHFNESGYMTTGWLLSNGNWYYLHPISDGTQGYMYTGWNQIDGQWYYMNPTEGATQGALVTGWQLINEKWYYFSEAKDSTEGMMLSSTTTPDGYVVGADGAWVQ